MPHEAVNSKFRYYYLNWPLTNPLALGDWGYLENKEFHKLGNITTSYKIKFETNSNTADTYFSLGGYANKKVTIKSSADIPEIVKTNVLVKFNNENRFFLSVAPYEIEEISELAFIGEQLKYITEWEREYVIVAKIIRSRNTVISISKETETEVEFSALDNESFNLKRFEGNIIIERQTGEISTQHSQLNQPDIPMFQVMRLNRKQQSRIYRGENDDDIEVAADIFEEEEGIEEVLELLE